MVVERAGSTLPGLPAPAAAGRPRARPPWQASWLNQAEVYFSIVQRKVLTPNDFPDLDTLEQQLLAFGRRYEQIAAPFEWKFTRADLDRLGRQLDLPAAHAA